MNRTTTSKYTEFKTRMRENRKHISHGWTNEQSVLQQMFSGHKKKVRKGKIHTKIKKMAIISPDR